MPEWLIVIAAVAGIFLIGLIFSAVDLIKDVAKTVFISLFVFLLILIVNRYLVPSETNQSYDPPYSPDSSFIEPSDPDSLGTDAPDIGSSDFPDANDFQNAPDTDGRITSPDGTNLGSRVSEYFDNLAEDIDEFVFGSPQYGSPSQPGAAPERDLIYVLPPDASSQGTNQESIASQPPNQPPSQPPNQPSTTAPARSFQPPTSAQRSRSSAGTTTNRPVPAMW